MSSSSFENTKERLKDFGPLYLNKYVLVAAAFLVWVSFFDNNNLLTQQKMKSTITELEGEISNYHEKLEEVKQEEKDLANNIEKLAREKYKFGAPNEDIFIIESKKEN